MSRQAHPPSRFIGSPRRSWLVLPCDWSPVRLCAINTNSLPTGRASTGPQGRKLFRRWQFAIIDDRKALTDAVIIDRQHIGPPQVEDQQHLGGPAADASDLGQPLD